MTKETKEALKGLLDFYDDEPKRWIQKRYYGRRNPQTGRAKSVANPREADCFCLLGRIEASVPRELHYPVIRALLWAAGYARPNAAGSPALVRWNDDPNRTFPQVKRLLQKALAETQGT